RHLRSTEFQSHSKAERSKRSTRAKPDERAGSLVRRRRSFSEGDLWIHGTAVRRPEGVRGRLRCQRGLSGRSADDTDVLCGACRRKSCRSKFISRWAQRKSCLYRSNSAVFKRDAIYRGSSSAGLRSKQSNGRSSKLCQSTGITGQSSARTM